MFLSVKKRPCKVAVGSETEDVVVVPTVHMTHFSWLGTGCLEVWTIKIRFKKNFKKLALSWCIWWDPLGICASVSFSVLVHKGCTNNVSPVDPQIM